MPLPGQADLGTTPFNCHNASPQLTMPAHRPADTRRGGAEFFCAQINDLEMAAVLAILTTIMLPVLLIVALGALVQRAIPMQIATLATINLYVFVPVYLLVQVSESKLRWSDIGLVGLGCLLPIVLLGAITFGVLSWCGWPRVATVTVLVGGLFTNAGNFGVPVAELAHGARGAQIQSLLVMFANLSVFIGAYGILLSGAGARVVGVAWLFSHAAHLRLDCGHRTTRYELGAAVVCIGSRASHIGRHGTDRVVDTGGTVGGRMALAALESGRPGTRAAIAAVAAIHFCRGPLAGNLALAGPAVATFRGRSRGHQCCRAGNRTRYSSPTILPTACCGVP